MKHILTSTLALGLIATSLVGFSSEAQAKKAGAKYKDLTPELQQVVLQEVRKFSQQDLIDLYLEKATPKDLLVIINASGASTQIGGTKQ